jgi:hypothetical protein
VLSLVLYFAFDSLDSGLLFALFFALFVVAFSACLVCLIIFTIKVYRILYTQQEVSRAFNFSSNILDNARTSSLVSKLVLVSFNYQLYNFRIDTFWRRQINVCNVDSFCWHRQINVCHFDLAVFHLP